MYFVLRRSSHFTRADRCAALTDFRVHKYMCRAPFEVCSNTRSTNGVLSAVSRMLVWTDIQSGDAHVLSHSVWLQPFSAKCLDLTRRRLERGGGEFTIWQGKSSLPGSLKCYCFGLMKNNGPLKIPKIKPFLSRPGFIAVRLDERLIKWRDVGSVALISNHPNHSRCCRLAWECSHN